ncbi:MAG: SLATT domain-containing protein [Candidatus Caenarcaniphilales bacterium]|nr:SLATT domain-containing protein [Candidatus Caenarcaniphilales bacterium]
MFKAIKSEVEDFQRRVKITRGARYNAFRRNEAKSIYSSCTLIFLSIFIFALNLLPYYNFLNIDLLKDKNSSIQFSALILSVFLLVFSLLEANNSYKYNADKFHGFAIGLENIVNELDRCSSENQLERIKTEYVDQLEKSFLNHLEIDYLISSARYYTPSSDSKCLDKVLYWLKIIIYGTRNFVFTLLPYLLLISLSVYYVAYCQLNIIN